MEKTCTEGCVCKYKVLGGIFFGCVYAGYCDFQAQGIVVEKMSDERVYPLSINPKELLNFTVVK